MSASAVLRAQDVRDAHRLIGECRELGTDPALWHRRLFEELSRLIGVHMAAGMEGWWGRPAGIQIVSAHHVTDDPEARASLLAYHRAKGPSQDLLLTVFERLPGPQITRTRPQLVPDSVWYRSESFQRYRRPGGVDDELGSICRVSGDGAISAISLSRRLGDRVFSEREQLLVEFLHAELGRLIGGPLVSDTEPSPEGLSLRLRQTLACLLEGDDEKQVAARLGLSPPTVHHYVTALYRRFGVRSRAQLLAHAMRRLPNESRRGPDPRR
jgi:DNA-binding CsgD family transcriptional regulator